MTNVTMKLVKSVSLALALIGALSSAHAAAQAPDRKPIAKPPAPAAKPATNAQDTPRAILERGAFVEEHERDFDAAAKLYEQAASAAQAQGDTQTATDARAALARVHARQGKPEVIDWKSVAADDPITNRIHQLLEELSRTSADNGRYSMISSDLVQFGATVVPLVEEALSGQVALGSFGVVKISSTKAAQLLAQVRGPEAQQALVRALASPDPVIRRSVVQALDPSTQRALLEKAAIDAAPGVREAAIDRLVQLRDPALLAVIEPAARAKMRRAIEWMSWGQPQRLIDIALAPGADDELKTLSVAALRRQRVVPVDPRLADALLELCRTSSDENTRRDMPSSIAELFRNAWLNAPPEFRRRIETAVLERFDEYRMPGVLSLLREVGRVDSIRRIVTSFASKCDDLANGPEIRECIAGIVPRLTAADFSALVGAYRSLPNYADLTERGQNSLREFTDPIDAALRSVLRQGPTIDVILEEYQHLDARQSGYYLVLLETWMAARWDNATGTFLAGTVDVRLRPLIESGLSRAISTHRKSEWFLKYAEALGDVTLLPIVVSVQHSGPSNDSFFNTVAHTVTVLLRRDPDRAHKALEDAMIAGWDNPSSLVASRVSDIALLPAADALAMYERLWPHALAKDKEQVPESRAERNEILRALTEIVDARVTKVLFDHYREIDNDSVWAEAIDRAGRDLYEPAIPRLGEALKSPSDRVRAAAQNAFKQFKAHREALEEFSAWMSADKDARTSIADLSKLLESNNRDVVIGAVRALGAVKARSALPSLVKLLERSDPELKKAVEDAIAKIGG
jgi:HEAT repeat protein